MDSLDSAKRSENMRRIKSRDTSPELAVRSMVHHLGYRFRLHRKDLPGKPDLVFAGRRKAIFVHGCFWHQHTACREGRIPRTRPEYWVPKLTRNCARDRDNRKELKRLGWRTLVVWECELNQLERVKRKVVKFLAL